jgi:hypothetical protein
MELGLPSAPTPGARLSQQLNAWEAPRLPCLSPLSARRWATSPTWTPPDSQLLVRHRSIDGNRRVVTDSPHSPEGFTIEYNLGLTHRFAQPGTRRLVASGDPLLQAHQSYFRTSAEGALDDGYYTLGYLEEAPFPMLDALELRRDPTNGAEVLVAGTDDPLYGASIPEQVLGFVESYPIQPRHPPDLRVEWSVLLLLRHADSALWRHSYAAHAERVDDSVSLGGLWTRGGDGFVGLYRSSAGWLGSEIAPAGEHPLAIQAKLRWALAPLRWTEGRPRAWAARAAASRFRALGRERSSVSAERDGSESLLGYLRREPAHGWSPIFSAFHPALTDQYVTRSELEATDMGYIVHGVLGYVLDRPAARSREVLPAEVKWASRFGQRRRYLEGFRPEHGTG